MCSLLSLAFMFLSLCLCTSRWSFSLKPILIQSGVHNTAPLRTYPLLCALFYCSNILSAELQKNKVQYTGTERDLPIHTVQRRERTSGHCIRIATLHLCDPQSCGPSQIWIKPGTWSPFREAVHRANWQGLIPVCKSGPGQGKKGWFLLFRFWWMNCN